MGEGAFLREEHTNQLTGAERSALKIYRQVIVYWRNKLNVGVYRCAQMQKITISENKEATNFQRKKRHMGGLRGRERKKECN